MEFKPLSDSERATLSSALKENAFNDRTILMDPRNTSFDRVVDEVPDEEVISAIRSVPCHY